MEYEQLLNNAYKKVKTVTGSSERFEIPKVKGQVAGKNTIITNIQEIASYIRRPVGHLAKFLLKELATPGRIENSRLILNRRLGSGLVNDKIGLYVKEFVLCHECKKPDTEIISEKGIKFKHCLACGAKYPIKSKI
ncbi:translation initiation factor IF-2 subunit beta [Candidatus Pacearchaeota archaeon CG10_big_fil_rev_8_21_14_0_10_35_219]|nr:translation initiation factor IF-2 subunit beta [Candidatus Pacearchaeota archaeon]OIO42745.1 MAG: translation initiation factor IF-2 subunit beta [Candidatus Pacearchaeota archaeon CG1_02_35_32]PIO08211.1 MAG: translation initiation factor IF-2 subunit beta [Candidatus Pacearchaeota archaeon CG10_big_fil_rev_8_21_14_0_10_35_219]PIY81721.1 MAG: translation initiation factor IF-2 subunit beta [Candidatus Pacearchaeota archaeon CG_4_10_14_0_8_um_filter_35_169]PIZ80375.1 MAG: translation initia